MFGTLDDLYLQWLYSLVGSVKVKSPSKTYWSLVRQLYTKEFVWLIPNDDNRVEDGKDLRYEFIEKHDVDVENEWMNMGCSMLEMMIALARRLAFEDGKSTRDWFWIMIDNLGISDFNDRRYNEWHRREVEVVLDNVIWRTYSPDGFGGLFPLQSTTRDQREMELWYQLCEYINERH